ncbi:MAG: hypothetical protein ABSE41_12525 [Bacteroidota bacterium]|jgi:hypothetical protein
MSAVIYGEMSQPVSRSEFVKAEAAVLNAFKAVEAIIGDPPKNEKKFRQCLIDVGLDPDELVGFVGRGPDSGTDLRVPICEKIRQMSYVRDKKAAHGRSSADRRLSYFQIMDFQECAATVVQVAIEHKLGWQNGG